MKRALLLTVPLIGAGALLAGCGSSASTSSQGGGAPAGSSSVAAASTGRSYGGYGGAGSSSTSSPSSAPAANSSAVKVTTKQHGKLGMILAAGPKQMTVYLFEGDKASSSNCSGGCAGAWPPVTTSTAAAAAGSAMGADIGTITRTDGTKQVTYKGHPLYYFLRDKDAGDAYGQGVKAFGASWYVLAPSGKKVDNS